MARGAAQSPPVDLSADLPVAAVAVWRLAAAGLGDRLYRKRVCRALCRCEAPCRSRPAVAHRPLLAVALSGSAVQRADRSERIFHRGVIGGRVRVAPPPSADRRHAVWRSDLQAAIVADGAGGTCGAA